MSWRLAAAALLAAALGGGAQAQDNSWQFELHSSHHSDALRLADFGGDAWSQLAPRRGRNLVYLDDGLRLARQQGAWTWALVARSQATLVASEQALLLAADVNARRRPAGDAAFGVDVQLRGYTGAGLALGRSHALADGWRAQWEAQVLQLGRWLQRRFEGPVQYQAASATYHFALQSSELDNRLDFPFRQDFASHGTGLLLGGALQWDGEQAWARAELRDGGRLRWRGLPQQQATLDTATQAVDSDGFLIYRPLIEGRNTQAGLRRTLPWHGVLAAGLRWGGGQTAGLRLEHVPGYGWLPALTWQGVAAAPGCLALGARWQVHERRLVGTLAWRGLELRAGADRLGANARSRELALTYLGAF